MDKIFSPHLSLAKNYWKAHLKPNDLSIDATCGNGHDSLFLADISSVISIDIQVQAINNTRALLEKHGKRGTLHNISHSEIDQIPLPQSPHLIVYNLGYLPHGDKSITTQTETTLISIQKSINLLSPKGAISITCYPGHTEGKKEEEHLINLLKLPVYNNLNICHHRWINKTNAPSLIWILKH